METRKRINKILCNYINWCRPNVKVTPSGNQNIDDREQTGSKADGKPILTTRNTPTNAAFIDLSKARVSTKLQTLKRPQVQIYSKTWIGKVTRVIDILTVLREVSNYFFRICDKSWLVAETG